ncbi:methylenetetrahydrofolate reductase [Rhodoluna sp.]|uniref:methylenetetrahydrofolate reductase n=1 Tax=Rhodoluna sp. TaxID=1969481 RepID=UPI0025F7224D|nr:methylenetetrahydrofolate reductase [Rhodoluna sp.]
MPEINLLRTDTIAVGSVCNITETLAARANQNQPTLSFEFFPPKDEVGEANLWAAFDKLAEVKPDFVSVTYGAGGSNRERSLAIVDRMAKDVMTIGHLTCVGSTRTGTSKIIKHFEDAGVAAILALRGDSPKDDPDALEKGELKTALELVQLAHEVTSLEVGVAAFPEVHPESAHMQHDAMVLALKQQAGASFAMTQLFFTVEAYTDLIEASSAAGADMPIIPGVMPIANAKQVIRMAAMSGAHIPPKLMQQLEDADEVTARKIGMDYITQLSLDLIKVGAPGLHIFSLNQSVAALELARGVGLCR